MRRGGAVGAAWAGRRGRAGLWLAATILAAGCVGAPGGLVDGTLDTALAAFPDGDCLGLLERVDLQYDSIEELQRALTGGRITSVELVDAYVARIAAFDTGGPKLNSVRAIHPAARAQAEALDAERAAGHVRGPLHGIPILLKDNIGTNDQPTTAGSIALANNVPGQDATLTARLREEGGIILGKTNLSEFANWVSLRMPNGYSSLGGQVVNAYTRGDPSGSSSGSGVAGSMALAAGTLGTETSGSILSPSLNNSLVGLKPTLGLVSRAGVIPLAANFDTPGPMTRTVYDAAVILSGIAGSDPRDPATAAADAHVPLGGDYMAGLAPDALKGARLGYDTTLDSPVFKRAREDLVRLGATLVPLEDNDLDSISLAEIGLIFNEFKFGINQYLAQEAGPGLPVRNLDGIILYNQEHPDRVQYGQDLLIASDATPGSAPLADVAALPVIAANRALADQWFAQYDLDALIGRNAPYTGLGAAAGYPTVVVPAGYKGRIPEGLSFFGPAWSEAKLLAFAYAYEQGTMRRQAPPALSPSLLDGVCAAVANLPEPPAARGTESEPEPAAGPPLRPDSWEPPAIPG